MFRLFSTQRATASQKQHLVKGGLILVGALALLWLIIWLLPSSAPPPVSSDEAGTVAVQPDGSSSSQLLTPGRVLVVLLLGGGLGYALYLRRASGDTAAQRTLMQPLGHLPLTQDQQLKLVGCQDEVLLIGVSSDAISLLRVYPRAAFTEDENAAAAAPRPAEPPAPSRSTLSEFADVLHQHTHNGRHA